MQDLQQIKKKELSKADSFKLLENNLEYVLNKISNNISYASIAKEFNINVANLCFFLNQDEIREKKEIALEIASDKQVDIARQHLESIEADDTNASVRKKSELSQFELYLAKVKCRKKYDLNYREEKQETNNNIITPQLTLKVVNNSENQLKITNE